MYNFDGCNFSHEYMMTFMNAKRSSGNKTASTLEREICETFHKIQNSFYSVVNAFTALERKHDEIVGRITRRQKEAKMLNNIMKIIVFLKRWVLYFEQGYSMGTKFFWFYGSCINHMQQFDRNSRESCLAGKYLQSIGLKYVK